MNKQQGVAMSLTLTPLDRGWVHWSFGGLQISWRVSGLPVKPSKIESINSNWNLKVKLIRRKLHLSSKAFEDCRAGCTAFLVGLPSSCLDKPMLQTAEVILTGGQIACSRRQQSAHVWQVSPPLVPCSMNFNDVAWVACQKSSVGSPSACKLSSILRCFSSLGTLLLLHIVTWTWRRMILVSQFPGQHRRWCPGRRQYAGPWLQF